MRTFAKWCAMAAVAVSLAGCGAPNRHPSGNAEDENENFVEKAEQSAAASYHQTEVPSVKMLNVYVENSGSMDGYVVNGGTLAVLVEDYLNELGHCGARFDDRQYYFINSKVIQVSESSKEYADKMQPAQFRKAGGDRGTSDLADIFERIVPTSGDTLCVFVSDMIFSPGKGQNADDYISRQCNRIKERMRNVGGDMSVLLYRFEGKYDGTYYDKHDGRSPFAGERPFFLCVIGRDVVLRQLRGVEGKLNVPIKNKCIITHSVDGVRYAIAKNGRDYEVDRNNNHAIGRAKLSKGKGHARTGGQPRMAIGLMADFSELLCNEQYLLDTGNYSTNNEHYRVTSVRRVEHEHFSHALQIESTSNNAAVVRISLRNKLPGWVYRFNDDEGLAAKPSDSVQCTYGLKRLVRAMYDAFANEEGTICDMEISINQKGISN